MGTVSPFEGVSEPPTNSVTTFDGVGGGGVSEEAQAGAACQSLLSSTNSISALSWNPDRGELAVSNGPTVDIYDPVGKTASVAFNLGGLDETAVVLAYNGNFLYAASANDSKLLNISTGVTTTIGTAAVVDALVWFKEDDSNPSWTGAVYTPPGAFLIEAVAAGWKVFDLSSGVPVTDLTEPLAGISSLDYREGQVYVGTATGARQYDWVTDTETPYTTITTPAIVNDTVNDISASIPDSVETTNVLSSTDDLSQEPQWGRTNCTVEAVGLVECTGEEGYRITGTDAFPSILQQTSMAWTAERYVLSVCMRQSPNSVRPCIRVQDGLSSSRTYEFIWVNGKPQFDQFRTSSFGTPVDILYLKDPDSEWWRVAIIFDADATGTAQVALYSEYNTSTGADTDYSAPDLEQSANLHDYVRSIVGPTTADTPAAKQYVNEDIGGGVIVTQDTGLFIPSWHVDTAADVSVFADTNDIYDITGLTGTGFGGYVNNEIFFTDTTGQVVYVGPNPTADITVGAWNTASYDAVTTTSPYFLPTIVQATAGGTALFVGTDGGLTAIDDPLFPHITITYNTGSMKDPQGAWANDSDGTTLVAPAVLPDNSGQGNDATVIGTLTKAMFADVFGVDTSDVNGFSFPSTVGGQLIGWEKVSGGGWRFRRDISEFTNAVDNGSIVEVKGLAGGSSVAMVRWNKTPMTEAELDETEKSEKCIAVNATFIGTAYSDAFDEGYG